MPPNDALTTRARRVLCGCGCLALCCAALWAAPAHAAPPPAGLQLLADTPDSLNATRAHTHAHFESHGAPDRTLPSHGPIAMAPIPTASEPIADDGRLQLRAPAFIDAPPLPQKFVASRRATLGVAGTGASLLSGALYSHGKSDYSREALDYYHRNLDVFQRNQAELPAHASTHDAHDAQQEVDETRHLMLALYAAGGTLVTESIILLTDESDDPTSTRAEIAPTWQNGGPAAYFRLSF